MASRRPRPAVAFLGRLTLLLISTLILFQLPIAQSDFVVELPLEYKGSFRAALVSVWTLPTAPSASPNNSSLNPIDNSSLNIDNLVVSGAFSSARVSPTNGDRNGSIVLYDSDWQGIYLIDDVLRFQREKASAVVIGTSYAEPGRAVWILQERVKKRPEYLSELTIPVFQVINADGDALFLELNKATNLSNYRGYLTSENMGNPFLEASESVWATVVQVAFIVPSLVGICLVFYRLIPRCKYTEVKLRLPFIVMGLELLSHLFRLVFAVDPFGMRGVFDPFSALFWFTPNVAVSLICHFIVLFYWNRAMTSFGAKRLDHLRVYVYVLFGVIVAIEISSAIMRGLELGYAFLMLVQIFYVILEIVVLIYIIYTAVGIFRYLAKKTPGSTQQERARAKVLRMTRLIVATGGFLVIIIILSGVALLPPLRRAYPEMILWLGEFTCLACISICETLVLKPVSKDHKNDSKLATVETAAKNKSTTGIHTDSSLTMTQQTSMHTDDTKSKAEQPNNEANGDEYKEKSIKEAEESESASRGSESSASFSLSSSLSPASSASPTPS